MDGPPMALDLRHMDDKHILAIQKRADREGVSFEDAALLILLEASEKDEKSRAQGPIARLLNFRKKPSR